jgi:uncharacterized repeat protein (TIGR01451 family)
MVMSGVFLSTMDSGMINVALPTIMRSFDLSLEHAGFIVSLYLLTITVTLVFWGKDPSELSTQDKSDINAWIASGGKLIIWDSETAAYFGGFDYTWLTFPFSVNAPGAFGATGWPLLDMEENQLSSINPASPFYVNNYSLSQFTDAVGDAAIFTARNPSDWCVDYNAINVLELDGPVHVYSKHIGTGIIIYSGLDWDYQTTDLKNLLNNEFNADSLPCSYSWTGNVIVTKEADKAVYQPGDTIIFTITVTNPAANPSDIYDAVLTDTPPVEITLIDPAIYNLGNIAPGATITQIITATAVTPGTNLINTGAVVGKNAAGSVYYSGSAQEAFDMVSQNAEEKCISGYKLDQSDNSGIPGWTIILTNPDGSTVSTTTGATGFYQFCQLMPGEYHIEEEQRAGWIPLSPPTININLATTDVTNLNFTNQREDYPVTEFPSIFLPATMIIGFLGAVLFIQRTRDY